jgi:RHS repeat-associated protein
VNGGLTTLLSFDSKTNHVLSSGYNYDAAGNMTSDGYHTYTYDAEGNVTQVDNGNTAKYTYNALNQRVRIDQGGVAREFVFDWKGQRTSIWDGVTTAQVQGQAYWGTIPIEFYNDGAFFQHQDWLGTERLRTSSTGTATGSYTSLPFGDGYNFSGADNDAYHFAQLDHDSATDTQHAQFRQYSDTQGRWMSPDPYDGSYDLSNPQSFNRYSYVLNNPLSAADPDGLFTLPPGFGDCWWCWDWGGFGGAGGPIVPPGGEGGGGGGGKAPRTVVRSFPKTFSCNATSQQLTSAIENNFWQLADYTGTGGSLSSYTLFAPAAIVPGQTVDITAGVELLGGAIDAHNWQVTVGNVSPTSFTFNTVQGQHGFYPGSVTFSVTPAGNGQLTFSVNVNATYANFAYWAGGKLYGETAEGNTWNNLANNVASFCAAKF